MAGDWIKLHRKSIKSAVFQDPHTWRLWTWLLMEANWERRQLLTGEWLEPGELIIGQQKVANELEMSYKQLRNRLQQLSKCGNLVTKRASNGTHITICNWATYQDSDNTKGRAKGEPGANQGRAKGEPGATEEEVKKERSKEGKNNKGSQARRFVPPSVNEVSSYCNQRSNHVDASQFVDHYEARGWMIGKNKMRDWKAAVRTWERNGHSNGKPQNGLEKFLSATTEDDDD